jgi:hypothetical protein
VPLFANSKRAQQAGLCYLALIGPAALAIPIVMNEVQPLFVAFADLRTDGGGRIPFEVLLREADSLTGQDERLSKAAGLTLRDIKNPLRYYPQVAEFARRLQKDLTDTPTCIYIEHANGYLTSYEQSKAKRLRSRRT